MSDGIFRGNGAGFEVAILYAFRSRGDSVREDACVVEESSGRLGGVKIEFTWTAGGILRLLLFGSRWSSVFSVACVLVST